MQKNSVWLGIENRNAAPKGGVGWESLPNLGWSPKSTLIAVAQVDLLADSAVGSPNPCMVIRAIFRDPAPNEADPTPLGGVGEGGWALKTWVFFLQKSHPFLTLPLFGVGYGRPAFFASESSGYTFAKKTSVILKQNLS